MSKNSGSRSNNQYHGCLPEPIELSRGHLDWIDLTRTEDDPCAIAKRHQESTYPGCWNQSSFDPRPESSADHQTRLSTLMTHQKTYLPHEKYMNCDSKLTRPPLTNLRTINQLYTRPYLGNYQGPGRHSTNADLSEVESRLWQGEYDPHLGSCGRTGGLDITTYGFNYLPCFGNPQRVNHVVEPIPEVGGWIRGGEHTRDLVRRVDYRRRCLNKENSEILKRREYTY